MNDRPRRRVHVGDVHLPVNPEHPYTIVQVRVEASSTDLDGLHRYADRCRRNAPGTVFLVVGVDGSPEEDS